ncbi:hypothetical protein H489_0109825 [Curtobacterium flaccumfaciens UCD-AKU]|uniref:DUF4913 domain-containing protein n=1 Tax=Curtobacterium flaccumfaciens TaxID=2035 RepID=UPI00037355A0|nr:DUF4913 domain-containing protein [Curtobacterium flaccumfaciens]EYT63961.1 hypothetical protein H489_0109825 [Curtobacterium flaccumfaciens UCD-AKU]
MSEIEAVDVDVDGADDVDTGAPEEGGNPFQSMFYDWVQERFARVEVTGSAQRATWCPEWWKHPEVIDRLQALWTAYIAAEAEQEDENGNMAALSDWWIRHWDPHRAVLFDAATGPFRDCSMQRGHLYDGDRDRVNAIAPARPPEQ